MDSDDVSQLVESLITKYIADKSVFFVGAGISVDSGYPDFQRLSKTLIQTVSQNNISGEDAEYLSRHLRPEVIFQIGQDIFGEEILLSMEVLERGKSNVYHYFLAEAIKRGCSVFTTNVDNLYRSSLSRKRARTRARFLYLSRPDK